MQRYFKRIIGVGSGNYIYFWKSEGMPYERINFITISNLDQWLKEVGCANWWN